MDPGPLSISLRAGFRSLQDLRNFDHSAVCNMKTLKNTGGLWQNLTGYATKEQCA